MSLGGLFSEENLFIGGPAQEEKVLASAPIRAASQLNRALMYGALLLTDSIQSEKTIRSVISREMIMRVSNESGVIPGLISVGDIETGENLDSITATGGMIYFDEMNVAGRIGSIRSLRTQYAGSRGSKPGPNGLVIGGAIRSGYDNYWPRGETMPSDIYRIHGCNGIEIGNIFAGYHNDSLPLDASPEQNTIEASGSSPTYRGSLRIMSVSHPDAIIESEIWMSDERAPLLPRIICAPGNNLTTVHYGEPLILR